MAKAYKRKYKDKTNLDIRAYALERGFTLTDVAEYMGHTKSWFSWSYMSRELCEEDKKNLRAVIDRMVAER